MGVINTSQIRVSGQAGVCNGSLYTYTATPTGANYTYNWTYPNNWTMMSQSGNQITLYTPQYSTPDGGTVRVSINDGCGASSYSGITVYPMGCGAYMTAGEESFSVYPNPANDQFKIEKVVQQDENKTEASEELKITASEEFTVKLYNKLQEVVATSTSKEGKVSLDISMLPADTYFLNIHYQDKVLKQQVLIE